MTQRSTTTTAGTQPIPGYTLRKRLGAGGYGEVWLADAPGGLQKAVKLIYGNVDDARAANELRSLDRIRSAHHPFILSLERIEIVQGKVIIVTELAEGSLQDRFDMYRRQGAPGMPRAELLDFLRDSADALDFLAQKHSLQHLDVKPGNLLIIANHIKVADFGLVKDLHDPNQSLVSGLTPTYSAPEVFDGRPDFRSDQYSLAIVYMEMLTGRLPFNGKTPGELARQHLTQSANLEPLPPADRAIVLRALSKNPLDRYSTCRQFIDHLLKVRGAVVPVQDSGEKNKSNEESSAASILVTDTRNWSTSRKQSFESAISLQQFADKWQRPRAMFIGVGGQGVLALHELRNDILHNVDNRFTTDEYGWLAVDTSRDELERVLDGERLRRLPMDSAVLLPINSPQAYKNYDSELFAPLSRRWLYNIPRSLSTEGVRPIATLALIANYKPLAKLIETRLAALIRQHQADTACSVPLGVYITGSLHGGTGSALLSEIGLLVRRAFLNLGFNNYRLCAVASVATTTNRNSAANLRTANAIASLSELTYFMNPTIDKPCLDYRSGHVTSSACPFDWVTLVDGGMLEDRKSVGQNPQRLARCISLDNQTICSSILDASRKQHQQTELGWLRCVRTETVKQTTASTPESLAKLCCLNVLRNFSSYLTSKGNASSDVEGSTQDSQKTLSTSFLPLNTSAIQRLIERTFEDMGLNPEVAMKEEFKEVWSARLSTNADIRKSQLSKDLELWQRWLAHHAKVRVYTWRQIERIQLEGIQGLLNYVDQQLPALLDSLRRNDPRLTTQKSDSLEAIRLYMNELIRSCVHFMQQVRFDASQLSTQIQQVYQSQLEDSDFSSSSLASTIAGLATQTKQLFDHVCKQLEDRVGTRLIMVLRSAPEKIGLASIDEQPNEADAINVTSEMSAQGLLEWSIEFLVQNCRQMGLNPDDLECRIYHFSTVSPQELKDVLPSVAEGGGEVVRMIVTNQDQLPFVNDSLKQLNIANTTTVVPATTCLGTQLVCDAVNISIPHLISTFWRPTGATLSLVERLRTRIDIDWDDASALLNKQQPAQPADAFDSEQQGRPQTDVVPSVMDFTSPNSFQAQ
jgi:serine/threonine protein kinase